MNLILFGAPGSGKGTQAVVLAERLKIKRISLGDILRQEVKQETELGKEVKSYMEKGLLVPDSLVQRVIEENLDSNGFVLDGYPRNLSQAKTLDEIFSKNNITLDTCIYLDVDKQLIVDRLKALGRLDDFEELAPIKDWSTDRAGGPRKVVREDVQL